MASLVLGIAGEAIGGQLLGGFLGLTGAQIGGAIGALAGSLIDSALMPGQTVHREGPRLSDVNIQASQEGAPIPRLYGRMRVAGQLLWATRFKETATTTTTGGGKGGGGVTVTETDYAYSISFAVGLCAGPATKIGRVWADGNPIDLSPFTTRFYRGDETQAFDPLIEEIEGAGNTPAYRGLCTVVFEDMPLAQFGNRIPQLQFEVIKSLSDADPSSLENALTGVALIPGAGEFVYATEIVTQDNGEGATFPENAHNAASVADIKASLDELQALAPSLDAVSLVVGWFGSSTDCAECEIKPGVETATKDTYPQVWEVDGLGRGLAHLVSQVDGRPAYGGTPSDASVTQAIQDLNARGLAVMFCPFLFLDCDGYPWRGRIACDPEVDTTAEAATQVDAFFGGTWGWRRMVLHYAQLCADAGGVESFLIGSEFVGLTRTRSSARDYPAVAALKALAADVRAILPAAKIGYAADWSEYNNHRTDDGALLFNLDPLWSDANIDFVGIDNYMPLSDWRDGDPGTIHDRDALTANIKGGEDYDWYYASRADRDARLRTPIAEWEFRQKDIWSWWSNVHHDRPDGTATAWVPEMKPIRFCELGCPAIDKGANQPNVFFDPKSSESAIPYYSNGERDDLIQRLFLEAHLAFWKDPANNPAMVERIHAWCWDARPFPFFPARSDVWGDAANYQYGHWLNGRLGAVMLGDLVGALCEDLAPVDVSNLSGLVTGFAVTDTMSPRDALAPLALAYHFDAVEGQGTMRFVMRGRPDPVPLDEDDILDGFAFERAQETDLPVASRIAYIDASADYRQAVAEARRLAGHSDRVATSSLPLVLDQGQAIGIGQRLLMDAWVMRESASFALPPSRLALDPTDEVLLDAGGRARRLRLTGIDDSGARSVQALTTDPSVYEPLTGPSRAPGAGQGLALTGRALLVFLDLPLLTGDEVPWAPHVAGFASPWPGAVLVLKSPSDSGYTLDTALTLPAAIGETAEDFHSGPAWRWDDAGALAIRLYNGACASKDDLAVLGGANAVAVENSDGAWEVLQFANAALTAPGTWRLTRLLRGQAGTETAMRDPVAAGARVVVLDGAPKQLALTQDQYALPFHYLWGPKNKPISDPAYQAAVESFAGIGLRPLSPAHLSARWSGGDLALSWIRRTRIGGDSWDQTEVPLGEESEAYEVVIGSRVTATTSPTMTYTAAEIAADYPSGLPVPFRFTVYQLSASFGRGVGTTADIWFS
ncbi:MAG TPA: glycoside hydrolase TIM-barrel-like domain-containing protein [Rhizomicrobium sp.]|nr:glycoside hydrolase TIM-barrel-like domain-containing protein [Rhizomicrobium sp.]